MLERYSIAQAGATFLGPLRDHLVIWHTADLPPSEWLPEVGLVTPSDPRVPGTNLEPRRIAAQVVFSRQLFIQATPAVDAYIIRILGRALSQALDASCLYGTGPNNFQPLGVLNTPGVNNIAFPGIGQAGWVGLNDMRLSCLDHDVYPDSYGVISSPTNERELLMTPSFPGGSISTWAAIPDPKFFSPEVNDNRFFSGAWAYLCVGLFGGTADQPGFDVVVDPFTQATNARVLVTGSIYADVALYWPQVFAFSQPDPLPFEAKAPAAKNNKKTA
jgi:hypothetical protein